MRLAAGCTSGEHREYYVAVRWALGAIRRRPEGWKRYIVEDPNRMLKNLIFFCVSNTIVAIVSLQIEYKSNALQRE